MTTLAEHRSREQLEAGMDAIRASPRESGTLMQIVRRPQVDVRDGLVGDSWKARSSGRTPDGSPHPEMQLNIMNARAIALLAGTTDRWRLAGDQLYLDLDLSAENLPPGTHVEIGEAVIEITAQPHTGCAKFQQRFGADALRFVNSPEGRRFNLRGINAKVVQSGTIRVGDSVRKIVAQ